MLIGRFSRKVQEINVPYNIQICCLCQMTQQLSIQKDCIDLLALNHDQKRNIKNVLGTLIKDSYPASVVWAKAHRNICKQGRKISNIKEKNGRKRIEEVPICPCCSNQIIVEPFSLSYNTSLPSLIEQGEEKFLLSSGICLFFMFVKMCIYYLAIRFVMSDGYNIISSITGHYCSQNQDKCSDFFQSVLAGYNKHSLQDEKKLDIIDVLNCILVFISIAFFTYYRRVFDRVHVFLDEVNITEDDYSLLVQNIPSIIRSADHHNHQPFQQRDFNVPIEKHLHDMFLDKFCQQLAQSSREQKENYLQILREAQMKKIRDEVIVNVTLCYDLSEFQNINKIQRMIFDQLAEDAQSCNEFQQIYLHHFQEAKQKIRKEIKSDNFLSSRQKKDMIERKIFQLEANKAASTFIDNFRYRIKMEKLSQQDRKSSDVNIRKYLVFLSKIDHLSANARKKYVNRDHKQSYHSFFVGKAFITFQHQFAKHKLLQRYEKNPNDFKINNKMLVISEPTEPEDILWENLKVTNEQRAQSVFLSMLILFMCIGFSFIFTLIAQETQIRVTNQLVESLRQKELQRHYQGFTEPFRSQETPNYAGSLKIGTELIHGQNLSNIFNTLMIILTNLVNILLEVIIKKITDLERHKSKTDKIQAMINRFVVSKFLNTCVIYFILYMVNKNVDILSQNGLTNKIIKLVSIGAAIDILLNITLPNKSIKLLYYSFLYRNVSYVNTTQSVLNEQLSYPEFDFVERYSYYIVQLYLVSFYSYLCPIAVPLVLCVFIVQYWIDKANLFLRCSANNQMGFNLSQTTLKLCKSSLLIFAVGNIIFYQVINVYEDFKLTVLNVFTFFVCLAYILYVYRAPKFMKDWMQENLKLNLDIPYDEFYRLNFISSTYWSQNPATCKASKHRQISTDKIKIHDEPLSDGLNLVYMTNQTVDQLYKIFLPCHLKRYWKWEERYEMLPETYEKSDVDLFKRCFKLQ